MQELSIFIDESGDFGEYQPHSPYYIISIVFHNQKDAINNQIASLDKVLSNYNLNNNCIHTGPIVRRDEVEAITKLTKQISLFLKENLTYFNGFDVIKVYYDNGQIEVTKMLSSIFNTLFSNVVFHKVIPSQYKLFQAAYLFCYFKLLSLKLENKTISENEIKFFEKTYNINKNYIKIFKKLEFK